MKFGPAQAFNMFVAGFCFAGIVHHATLGNMPGVLLSASLFAINLLLAFVTATRK